MRCHVPDIKVGLWCITSAARIIVLSSFWTQYSEGYLRQILALFFENWSDENGEYMFFWKDGATIHTAHISKAKSSNIFRDWNSYPLWPVRSPDLVPCFFFFFNRPILLFKVSGMYLVYPLKFCLHLLITTFYSKKKLGYLKSWCSCIRFSFVTLVNICL